MKESDLQGISLASFSFTSFDGVSTRKPRFPEKTPSILEYQKHDTKVFPRHLMGFTKKPECTTIPWEIPETEKKELPRGPRWRADEEMSCAQQKAKCYFTERRIQDLFQYMIGQLLANTPEDPLAFLKDLMDRCLMYRSQVIKSPPLLFDTRHTESVFYAFDPLKSGFITKKQYHKAMETIGILEYERDPCTFKGLVPKEVWMNNSRTALVDSFMDMIVPPPEEKTEPATPEDVVGETSLENPNITTGEHKEPTSTNLMLERGLQAVSNISDIKERTIVVMEDSSSEVESNWGPDGIREFEDYSTESPSEAYSFLGYERKKSIGWSDMDRKVLTNVGSDFPLQEKKLTNVRKEVTGASATSLPQTKKAAFLFSSFSNSNPYLKNFKEEFEFKDRYNRVAKLLEEPPVGKRSDSEDS